VPLPEYQHRASHPLSKTDHICRIATYYLHKYIYIYIYIYIYMCLLFHTHLGGVLHVAKLICKPAQRILCLRITTLQLLQGLGQSGTACADLANSAVRRLSLPSVLAASRGTSAKVKTTEGAVRSTLPSSFSKISC
jgi:hypothetical protein